jgi:Plasmid pRiA4b ORF-3-like protein
MKHFTIKVALYSISPEIYRRFTIPANFTFTQFSNSIISAMGWDGKYDHEFRYGKGKYLRDIIAAPHKERFKGADSFKDEATITLTQFIGRSQLPKRILFLYDYADEWIHEITFEKVIELEHFQPVMIDGARACPPDACGGVQEYLEICAGESDWFDETFDSENFHLDHISFTTKK